MILTEADRKILERDNYKCQLCGRECEADAERMGRMRTYDVSAGMQVDDRFADGKVSVCLECIGRVHEVAHSGQTKEDRVKHLRDGPGSAANLQRCAEYYKANGIPFGDQNGFHEYAAYKTNRKWAKQFRIRRRHLSMGSRKMIAGW